MRMLAVVFATLSLAACGSTPSPGAGRPGTLPSVPSGVERIVIPPDSELARMIAPTAPSIAVQTAERLDHQAGTGKLWMVPADPPTEAEVRRLGDVFGLAGEYRPGDPNGTTATLGGEPGIDPDSPGALGVTSIGGSSFWTLSRGEAFLIESGAIPCPTLPAQHPGSGGCANGANPAALPAPAAEDDVRTTVERLMAAIGVESYDTDIQVYGPSTDVSVWFVDDGMRTPVGWRLGIAHDSTVSSASGQFRAPVAVGDIATVGFDEVLLRLGSVMSQVQLANRPPEPTTTPPGPGASRPAVVTTTLVPYPPIEPPAITSIQPTLTPIWDISNRLWLVPALTLTGTDGFVATIPTISADAVRIADPSEIDVPTMTAPPIQMPTAAPVPPTLTTVLGPSATEPPSGTRHPGPQATDTTTTTTTSPP